MPCGLLQFPNLHSLSCGFLQFPNLDFLSCGLLQIPNLDSLSCGCSSSLILIPCHVDCSSSLILIPCHVDFSSSLTLIPCHVDFSSSLILIPCRVDCSSSLNLVLSTQRNQNGRTMLSRHSVGIKQGNELARNSSGNARPQSRQLANHRSYTTNGGSLWVHRLDRFMLLPLVPCNVNCSGTLTMIFCNLSAQCGLPVVDWAQNTN